jgi:hypothetical protein
VPTCRVKTHQPPETPTLLDRTRRQDVGVHTRCSNPAEIPCLRAETAHKTVTHPGMSGWWVVHTTKQPSPLQQAHQMHTVSATHARQEDRCNKSNLLCIKCACTRKSAAATLHAVSSRQPGIFLVLPGFANSTAPQKSTREKKKGPRQAPLKP